MKITRKSFLAGLSATAVLGWSRLFAECRPFGAGARIPSGRIQRLLARALDHDVRPASVATNLTFWRSTSSRMSPMALRGRTSWVSRSTRHLLRRANTRTLSLRGSRN